MDLSLRCNNHLNSYCRKELRHEAFVTTCSHIFCTDCVQKYGFQDARPTRECLACGIGLASVGDVVFTNLRPTEERQSTALSGFDPNTIMECAGKAMKFWNYQMSTEIAWQEHLVKEMTNRYQGLHANARKVVSDANAEIGELQKQIESLNLEKTDAEKRIEEVVEMYKEKSQRCHTVSRLYDALKSKVQAEQARGAAAMSAEHTLQAIGSISRPDTNLQYQMNHVRSRNSTDIPSAKKTPNSNKHRVNQHGIEQLHPHQRSGGPIRAQTSSKSHAANVDFGGNMYAPGRPTASSMITAETPAQRVTLTRQTDIHTFPQTVHQPTMSQHFTGQSMDRQGFESQERSRQDHVTQGQFPKMSARSTPNMHSRMSANRGLY